MKLSVKALGLAGGTMWGVSLFLWTLLLSLTTVTWGTELLSLLGGLYPYYGISVTGAFAGLVVGFIDGFLCGAILAWLYNVMPKK